MDKTKILLLAEHDNNQLKNSTANIVSAAKCLEGDITVVVVGVDLEKVTESASKLAGVSKVLAVEHPCFQYHLAENVALLLAELGKNFQYILAPASTYGKNILPR